MERVLISPLGAGPNLKGEGPGGYYRKAKYRFGNFEKETSFVAEALVDFFDINNLILVGTSKSMWDEVYRRFSELAGEGYNEEYHETLFKKVVGASHENRTLDEGDLKPLEDTINKALNGKRSRCFIIEYGLNEDELWRNMETFLKIGEILRDGDEVFFDITHSFRSLSMFLYLSFQFLLEILEKKVKLGGIFYGMLDVQSELGYAPIIDLKPIFELNEWIKGAYNFKNYGNAYLLAKLIEGQNKKLNKLLLKTTEALSLNDIYTLTQALDEIKKMDFIGLKGPSKSIILQVEKFLQRFNFSEEKPHLLQLELSRWYYEKKRYALSLLMLREALISYECLMRKLDWKDRNNRENCEKSIKFSGEIKRIWNKVTRDRNFVAHPYGRVKDIKNLIDKIPDYIEETKRIFKGG